ncbi:restriction endonuclease subunit S [Vannielia sp.]|uniref:restriction endonuclease subunit S n=1 Tax=Vannielia sp. TaxID=2813045 RepID=UPI00261DA782|nr:restriction endonuclease subunit S [Vannielia sp.]MDF1871978.1 restriction endonuclease subunit S [Vannielia sp.]
MREGWTPTAFADIAEFRNGLNFVRGESGHTVKVVGVGDFQRHETLADFSDTASVTISNRIAQKDLLRDNDLLFVRSNGNKALVGRCVLISGIKEPVTFSGFTIRARVKCPNVDHSYLSKLVRSPLFLEHLYRRGGGSSISNLSQDALAEFTFGLPPLPEQRKIAVILRTWDEALEKLTALRATKARQLVGLGLALIDRAANEPATVSRPLADLVRIIKGKQLNKLDIASGEYPVWNGGISPSGFHDEWNTEGGTITISEGGNSCGFVNVSETRFWLGGHCYALQELSNMIERDFLFHALKSREAEIMRLRVGSGLPNIQRGDLERLQVVVPARDLQKKIALALTAGNEELTLLDTEIKALNDQKRGLMQKLLTGEWRVEVSDDEEAAA